MGVFGRTAMNKKFYLKLGTGFLFIILICGSVVLADYVFFEGKLLKQEEESLKKLKNKLKKAKKENEKVKKENKSLKDALKSLETDLKDSLKLIKSLEQKAQGAKDAMRLQKELEQSLEANRRLKETLNTPEHKFLAHMEDAIHGEFPGIEMLDGKFIFKDDIFFASASTVLTKNAKKILDDVAGTINKVAETISSEANWVIKVMGHTDQQNLKYKRPFSSNWILASSRAVTIVQYLISKGVDPSRIYAAGFSAHKRTGAKTSKEDLKKTRRAVISFDRRVGFA